MRRAGARVAAGRRPLAQPRAKFVEQRLKAGRQLEALNDVPSAGDRKPLREGGLARESLDRIGQTGHVVRLDQQPGLLVNDQIGNSYQPRRNGRQAAGHRFHQHHREAVHIVVRCPDARQAVHVPAVHEFGNALLLDRLAGDRHESLQAQPANLVRQLRQQRSAARDPAFEGDAAIGQNAAGVDQVAKALLLDQSARRADSHHVAASGARRGHGEVARVNPAVRNDQLLGPCALRKKKLAMKGRDAHDEFRATNLVTQRAAIAEQIGGVSGEAERGATQPGAVHADGPAGVNPLRMDVAHTRSFQAPGPVAGHEKVGQPGHACVPVLALSEQRVAQCAPEAAPKDQRRDTRGTNQAKHRDGIEHVRRRRVGTTIPENRNGSARVKENHAAGFTALLVILLNPGT